MTEGQGALLRMLVRTALVVALGVVTRAKPLVSRFPARLLDELTPTNGPQSGAKPTA